MHAYACFGYCCSSRCIHYYLYSMQEQTIPKKKRLEQYKKQKRKRYRQNKKRSLYIQVMGGNGSRSNATEV